MKDIIEGLNLIKGRLVQMERFDEAKICKELIKRLQNEDVINVKNNRGQINISGGNSTINAKQNIRVNSPLTTGTVENQTINYNKKFPWEDWE